MTEKHQLREEKCVLMEKKNKQSVFSTFQLWLSSGSLGPVAHSVKDVCALSLLFCQQTHLLLSTGATLSLCPPTLSRLLQGLDAPLPAALSAHTMTSCQPGKQPASSTWTNSTCEHTSNRADYTGQTSSNWILQDKPITAPQQRKLNILKVQKVRADSNHKVDV